MALTKEKIEEIKRKALERYKSRPELKYWFLLRNSVYNRGYEEAKSLLDEHPNLMSMRNFSGETVLHFLAVENDMEAVAWLFMQGFDINIKDNFGTPLIFEVASLGYVELTTWFKMNGADFNVENRWGLNIYEYLEKSNKSEMLDVIRQLLT